MCLDFLRTAAAQDKIVVFAKHFAVIDPVVSEFEGRCAVVHGRIPSKERQEAVDRFNNDPGCRVFVGQLQAAGAGLNLTASSQVVFVEFDWRPGMLEQAEDRCHRIGQKDCVTCSYLVVENSLDDLMLESTAKRTKNLAKALDA
jgi:SWI/SNF-related matrix-associated actin-dependent regulator 1 of chromatin subfamily A